MALEYWKKKYCRNCGTNDGTDRAKYTCQECGAVGCVECVSAVLADGDGNVPKCKNCLMKYEIARVLEKQFVLL